MKSAFGVPGTKEKLKKKEKSYDNRVTLMENLERCRPLNLRPKSAPPTDYGGAFASAPKPMHQKKKRQYRRCLEPGMPEDDLVLRGLYKLDDQQAKLYENFAKMLSQFDHYDAVCAVANSFHFNNC